MNWDRFSYSIHRESVFIPPDLDFLYVEACWDWPLWDDPRETEAAGAIARPYRPRK